ncbi:MAG: magnesium chelatase domain-containing protein [Actinomycetota bacterium]
MQPSVLCPRANGLVEVAVLRTMGPPDWHMDIPERSARIRSAITNSGFAIPTGEITAVLPIDATPASPALDLPLALCVLLSDRANEHLQRDGWIAWGALGLDGTLGPVDEPIVNDLGPGPYVGRIWEPTDHVPAPHEDAVISVVAVDNLAQAWDIVLGFARIEEMLVAEGAVANPN